MRGFPVLLIAGAACAGTAFAQGSAQEGGAAAVCAAMATEAERTACMRGVEAALAGAQPAADAREEKGSSFLGLGIFGGGDDAPRAAAAGLGAESLEPMPRTGQAEDRVHASIVAFREHLPGIFEFELDNGQVWRQRTGEEQEVHLSSRRAEPVEMWRSWAGGYRMRLTTQRQTLRVERLR